MLVNNSYPTSFIEKHITSRLQKIKATEHININNNDNKKQFKKCIVLPYVKGTYEHLSLCLKNYYIDTVPKSSKNLGSIIIKGKDKKKIIKKQYYL